MMPGAQSTFCYAPMPNWRCLLEISDVQLKSVAQFCSILASFSAVLQHQCVCVYHWTPFAMLAKLLKLLWSLASLQMQGDVSVISLHFPLLMPACEWRTAAERWSKKYSKRSKRLRCTHHPHTHTHSHTYTLCCCIANSPLHANVSSRASDDLSSVGMIVTWNNYWIAL